MSTANAEEIITADMTLTSAEKAEDLQFWHRICKNLPASLGSLNFRRKKRLKRVEERERQFEERARKEESRREGKRYRFV